MRERKEVQMGVSCGRIATLVTKMQSEFLNRPDLTLTLLQAQARFGADEITCQAVLGALVDARVLAKRADGACVRFFPRGSARAEADVAARSRRLRTALRHPLANFAA
jgi:hypothetical protein